MRRVFVDIEHGQVHCRMAGTPADTLYPPLLLLHGGPGSSAGLVPMIEDLAKRGFAVIAPDMMGNGLSDPPPRAPDIAFYAGCALAVLNRLGMQRVDCYGYHIGSQVAGELAVSAPGRVRKLVLDGVGLFSREQRTEFLEFYAPPVQPDASGAHLARLWAFLSHTTVRFPHYSDKPADRIVGGAPLPPPVLTDLLAEVVRNWRTCHLSYQAGFADAAGDRLSRIAHPTVVLEVTGDPLSGHAQRAASLLPHGTAIRCERPARAAVIAQFAQEKIRFD